MCVQQPRGQLLLRPIPDPNPPTRLLDPSPRPCEKGYEIWVGGGVPGLGGNSGGGSNPRWGSLPGLTNSDLANRCLGGIVPKLGMSGAG